MIKLLQGSAVTQTVLSEPTIHRPVANFLQHAMMQVSTFYESWLAAHKVIATIKGLLFWPTVYLNKLTS